MLTTLIKYTRKIFDALSSSLCDRFKRELELLSFLFHTREVTVWDEYFGFYQALATH